MHLLMVKGIIKIFRSLIQENGEMILDMELEKKSSRIKRENMLEILRTINIKEEANYSMKSLHMRVNSKLVYLMDRV